MTDTLFSNDFKTEPYWWEHVPTPERHPAPPPAEADVVVVGAGYTGLHAALQTARGGRHTVVLDAERAGWGCSTRNGGQVSPSIKLDYATLAARHGHERAFAIHREGREALAWIERFIESEHIDCDFQVPGRFVGAHNPRAFARLARAAMGDIPGLESDARVVGRDAQQAEIGSDAYHGGVVYPRHASLHPARYHRGLLERARAAGATVIDHCPAHAIERRGGRLRVATPRGDISAGDVLLASNGYTGRATPWQRRRVVPVGSYIIATEPLEAALMDRLMPRDRVISDSRRILQYYRPAPDRSRILFGSRVAAREIDPRASARSLHARLTALFPELASRRISHAWMGFVAYSFDALAHVGRHDGVHYAMGYCGSGVSMASYLGMRSGQRLLGLEAGRTAFDELSFATRPLYTGKPWFLGAAMSWYRLCDLAGV